MSASAVRAPRFRSFAASCLLLLGLLGLSACGGDSSSPDSVIASAQVTDGADQNGVVGTELSHALTLRLLNAAGTAVAGQTVGFTVTRGSGSVFTAASTSDANGIVSDRWTLGTSTGPQTVEVRWVDSHGTPMVLATLNATAVAAAPATILVIAGDGQATSQGSDLATPLQVRVADAYGNATPGITVAFAAADGGSLAPTSLSTDAAGLAASTWTLGQALGIQHATATVAGLPPASFTATSTAIVSGPAAALAAVSGDLQTVAQHQVLAQPLVVQVTNSHGNGLAGAVVTFAAETGSGYITSTTVTTDASGHASWQGYLNAPGPQQIVASVDGVDSVVFSTSVTAVAGHSFDGRYLCPLTYTSGNATFGPAQLLLVFQNGVFVPTVIDYTGATLDEATGIVTATWGERGYRLDSATMNLVIDPDSDAHGVGTFNLVVNGFGDGTFVASGTWACQRQ